MREDIRLLARAQTDMAMRKAMLWLGMVEQARRGERYDMRNGMILTDWLCYGLSRLSQLPTPIREAAAYLLSVELGIDINTDDMDCRRGKHP